MTRHELAGLKALRDLVDGEGSLVCVVASRVLKKMIVDAETEHAAEDRWHDAWSELDEATLRQVA